MHAAIEAIEYHLPEKVVTTADLAAEFPEWSVEKIDAKTGIQERHVAGVNECASDLGFQAARRLFSSGACNPAQIDFLIFCTQCPDYFLPSTACLLQQRLGIPTSAGALDMNLGCSGFIYGLGLAEGLVATGQATRVLLITAESYSKFIDPKDKSVRTIFGDAGAATLLCGRESAEPFIGPFVYGTDGNASDIIVPGGAMRGRCASAGERVPETLYMNGSNVVSFTLNAIPRVVEAALRKGAVSMSDVDLFVFHQANAYILEQLRRASRIPEDKFQISLRESGNTVSSTIPIALTHALAEGRLRAGSLVLLVGFGVGYSWGATLVRWVG